MAQRHKTRYQNVVYIETKTNGRADKVYYIRFRENGKSREIKIGKYSEGIREQYCNEKLLEMKNALRLGEQPPIVSRSHKKDVITFDQIAMQYFDARELHNKTNKQARSKYNSQLRPMIGTKDISMVSKSDILKIQTDLSSTRAPKTVNQYIQFIRAVYNFSIEEGFYDGKNPTKGVRDLKVDNKRERFLTKSEVKMLLHEIEDDDIYLFILFSLTTGGREGALLEIQAKDIDFEHNMITLKDKKKGDTYGGFLSEKIKSILHDKVRGLEPNDRIINMSERTLRRKLSKTLNKLFNQGLARNDRKNRVVIHTLRHTFASHLAINGTPIFTIQKLLNHRDIKHTLRYAKLAPDSGHDKVNEMVKDFY